MPENAFKSHLQQWVWFWNAFETY